MKTLTTTSAVLDNREIIFEEESQSIPQLIVFSAGINTYTKSYIDTYEPILTARIDSLEYQIQPFFLTEEEALTIERKIYKERENEYLKEDELNGKYIAQMNGEIIDKDDNFSDLTKRIYETYGYTAVFMTKVAKDKSHKLSPKFKKPD